MDKNWLVITPSLLATILAAYIKVLPLNVSAAFFFGILVAVMVLNLLKKSQNTENRDNTEIQKLVDSLGKEVEELKNTQIHIESGYKDTEKLRGKGLDHVSKTMPKDLLPYIEFTIVFKQPFKETPKVVVGFSKLDIEHGIIKTNSRIRIEFDPNRDVHPTHFDFKVSTWETSFVHNARISWMAYGIKAN